MALATYSRRKKNALDKIYMLQSQIVTARPLGPGALVYMYYLLSISVILFHPTGSNSTGLMR